MSACPTQTQLWEPPRIRRWKRCQFWLKFFWSNLIVSWIGISRLCSITDQGTCTVLNSEVKRMTRKSVNLQVIKSSKLKPGIFTKRVLQGNLTSRDQGVASLPHKCQPPLSSARQHPSYGDCLEVKREYYQNFSVLGCVTQCSQSAAHSCEQFLQVQQIRFVTLGPLRHA